MNALIWYLSDAIPYYADEGPKDYEWFPYDDNCYDDEETVYLYGDGVALGYGSGNGWGARGYGVEYSNDAWSGERGDGSMFGDGNERYPVVFED
jgi:hypothetical protein